MAFYEATRAQNKPFLERLIRLAPDEAKDGLMDLGTSLTMAQGDGGMQMELIDGAALKTLSSEGMDAQRQLVELAYAFSPSQSFPDPGDRGGRTRQRSRKAARKGAGSGVPPNPESRAVAKEHGGNRAAFHGARDKLFTAQFVCARDCILLKDRLKYRQSDGHVQ